MLLVPLDRMKSIVKVTQNFTDLHLNSNDDSGCRSSIANHRSKTGNKSAFRFVASQVDVDVKSALSDASIECYDEDDDGLLVSPRVNIVNVHYLPIQPNSSIAIAISPVSPLTTSKSENNIFEKNISSLNAESPPHFNVVSMSDLSDDVQYFGSAETEHHYMNDLSKNQVLNRLSDENITGKVLNRF